MVDLHLYSQEGGGHPNLAGIVRPPQKVIKEKPSGILPGEFLQHAKDQSRSQVGPLRDLYDEVGKLFQVRLDLSPFVEQGVRGKVECVLQPLPGQGFQLVPSPGDQALEQEELQGRVGDVEEDRVGDLADPRQDLHSPHPAIGGHDGLELIEVPLEHRLLPFFSPREKRKTAGQKGGFPFFSLFQEGWPCE